MKWSVSPRTLCQVSRPEVLSSWESLEFTPGLPAGLPLPASGSRVNNPPRSLCFLFRPVRYYDKDTTKPVSFYLSSLEELLAWTPGAEDGFNVALVPVQDRQPPLSSRRPRTLLCHDMMGGYLDDR